MSTLSAGVTDPDLDRIISLFRLLSDKTRLNILMLLAEGERNVTSLCQELQLPQPTVSHHLGLLRTHNILGNRRNGKQVFYTLNGGVNIDREQGMTVGLENVSIKIAPKSQGQMVIGD